MEAKGVVMGSECAVLELCRTLSTTTGIAQKVDSDG